MRNKIAAMDAKKVRDVEESAREEYRRKEREKKRKQREKKKEEERKVCLTTPQKKHVKVITNKIRRCMQAKFPEDRYEIVHKTQDDLEENRTPEH